MPVPRLVHSVPISAQPLSARDDDTLMTLSQAGSREAFAVLLERYAVRVVRLCFRFAGDVDQAKELAQAVWLAVWEHRARYRPGVGFDVWLITIARNRCRNELRRQRVVDRHVDAVAPLGADPPSEQIDGLLQREQQRRVRTALGRLPIAMQEALLMRYGEELHYDEMVEVLGAQESTLRSRVHHGLKLLKRYLERGS